MRSALPAGLALLLVLWVGIPAAYGDAPAEIVVRYRSNDTVYLSAGAAAGLAAGDQLEVLRGEAVIGRVEVIFVSEHSASCGILEERQRIQAEDLARVVAGSQSTADGVSSETEPLAGKETAAAETPVAIESSSTQPAGPPARAKRRTRFQGVVALEWESFQDSSGAGLDFDRLQTRVNFRARDIAGTHHEVRFRLRLQENRRTRPYSTGAPKDESRNRFYELALVYNPPEGRFAYQVGRIGVSPFVGIGYLDGAIGEVRVIKGFDVGAFYGSQPMIEELGFESFGKKFGGYTRYSALRQGPLAGFEMYLAGIRVEGEEDVSRDYVTLQTRYAPGGRWSLYQVAEVDINSGWREEATGKSSQLSNFSVTLNTEISQRSRFSLSYDRWERYRTEETRSVSEELFNNLLRQGLRARFVIGRSGGLNLSLHAGLRDQEGEDENTISFGAGIHHSDLTPWGLALGGDLYGYTNPLTEGLIARANATKRFRGGHEVAMMIGGRFYRDQLFDQEQRSNQWLRLGGWVELPWRLFADGEYEFSSGDDLEGHRLMLGVGYRF